MCSIVSNSLLSTSNKNNDVCRKCFFNSITQEKIIKKCGCCSNLFETSNWNSSQKYCSQKCNANQKTINTTQLNQCLYCQKNFIVYTSLIKYYEGVYNIGSYCSRKCLCKSNIEKNQINGSLNGTNTKPELKFKKICLLAELLKYLTWVYLSDQTEYVDLALAQYLMRDTKERCPTDPIFTPTHYAFEYIKSKYPDLNPVKTPFTISC